MSNNVKKASFNSIDELLGRLRSKQAEANTEAGSIGGGTSHPVGDVDDSTQDATEGARSAENTADVKHDQGSLAVDSTAPGTPGGQDSVQMNIGTSQKATGEDSAVETASAKPGKDDGGYAGPSSHPARTDNDQLDGNKYSCARDLISKIASARESGHALLAKLAVSNESNAAAVKRAGEAMGGGDAAGKLPPETVSDADSDANNPPPGKGEASKSAADEGVVNSIALTIKQAHDDADLVVEYLSSYLKAAEDEPGPPAGEESEGGEAPGDSAPAEGGSAPPTDLGPAPGPDAGPAVSGPMGGGGGSPLANMSAEDLILELLSSPAGEQLLGGAGGPGAGGDIGGADAMSGMMGGGGAPPAPGAPPVGAAPGDEAMLAEAMAQEGVSPAELQGKAAAASFKTITGWRPKSAEEAEKFSHIRNVVRELVGSR